LAKLWLVGPAHAKAIDLLKKFAIDVDRAADGLATGPLLVAQAKKAA
jgi:hypothetical protein